jgi:dUTP pyrophosphatase
MYIDTPATPRIRGFEIVSRITELDGFKKPRRGTKKSAGYDIFNNSNSTIVIPQGTTGSKIPTGIKAYMPDDNVLLAVPRSSMGFSNSTRLANTIGIVDADYYNNPKNEGEIFVKLRSPEVDLIIQPGEAICQVIFTNYYITDDDSETVGGDRVGGIGSTGK